MRTVVHGNSRVENGKPLGSPLLRAAATLLVVVLIYLGSFPGALAQSASTIGEVSSLRGTASADRGNGTVSLQRGDSVLLGDRITTGANSLLGIKLVDDTIFSLSANASMVMNELVYDPDGSNNALTFSLDRGPIGFLAGKIASTGNMRVRTPVATMGVRGTLPFTIVGDSVSFSIVQEQDGSIGEYTVNNETTGEELFRINATTLGLLRKLVLVDPNAAVQIIEKTAADLALEREARQNIFNILNGDAGSAPQNIEPQPNQDPGDPPGDQGQSDPVEDPDDPNAILRDLAGPLLGTGLGIGIGLANEDDDEELIDDDIGDGGEPISD